MIKVSAVQKIKLGDFRTDNLTIVYDGHRGLGTQVYVYVFKEPRTDFYVIGGCPHYLLDEVMKRFSESRKRKSLELELYSVATADEAFDLGKDIIQELGWEFKILFNHIDLFLNDWEPIRDSI